MTELKEKLIDKFQLFEKSLNGKTALPVHQDRKTAIAAFEKQGFPTLKHEEWKYTPVTSFISEDYEITPIEASDINLENYLVKGLDAFNVVLVNGVFSQTLSSVQNFPKGLVIDNLKEIIDTEKYNRSASRSYNKYNNDGFTALNDAFAENGIFIELADNQHIEKPVVIYNITFSEKTNVLSQPKVVVNIGNNSSISIAELHIKTGDKKSVTNIITEISQGEDSNVHYIKVQYEGDENHVGTTQVNQIGKCVFNGTTITLGGNVIRNNFNMLFHSAYSEAHLYGLALLNGTTHVDNHTVVDHAVPNCESNELYKNIVDDSASAVFNGKIFVRQDAQKTNAYQSSKNILLSKEANAFAKPQLEIWADDVKCSHGSTTGQLDKDALFYLKARGIGEKQAKAMLTKAYVNDILNKISLEPLRVQLEQIIDARFE